MKTERLYSLDVLRGLDMFLLTVVGPLVMAANKSWGCFPPEFVRQFEHGWLGFRFWDIIQPLFIFMSGAAIPFALDRRLAAGPRAFWRHVLCRVALLWFLGGLLQGSWASLDMKTFTPFSNTLQAIAVGYLTVAATMTFRSRRLMMIVPVCCASLYSLLLVIGGYGEFTNVAYRIERSILSTMLPEGNYYLDHPSHYTNFLTMLMYAAMAFAGYHATRIILSSREKKAKAEMLFAYGAVLLAVGVVSELWVPCIKPIYTLSFTAQAMGWSVTTLAVFYVVNDVLMWRRGFSFLVFFGQLALTAYFVPRFFGKAMNEVGQACGYGIIARLPPSSNAFVSCLFSIFAMVAIMVLWRRVKYGARLDR